jgi:hypothetical protein
MATLQLTDTHYKILTFVEEHGGRKDFTGPGWTKDETNAAIDLVNAGMLCGGYRSASLTNYGLRVLANRSKAK